MKLMKTLVPVATAAAAAASASADIQVGDTVSLSYVSYTPARAVTTVLNGTSKTVFSGFVNLYDNTNSSPLRGFCVQILESISTGTAQNYDVKDIEQVPDAPPSPMGTARATLVEDLYARHFADVTAATGGTAQDKAAAFGMVLWEIIHQDSAASTASGVLANLSLSSGNFTASGSTTVNTLANNMLASLGGGTGSFQMFTAGELFGFTNPTYQDFLIVVPGPTGFAALVGIAGLRRRRRN